MNTLGLRLRKYDPDPGEGDIFDYLVVEIKVDGEPLVDFNYYATDLIALHQSIKEPGEWEIITCWCGDLGCAGLKQGIHVRHEDERIFWKINEPEPRRAFAFDKEQAMSEIKMLPKQADGLIKYLGEWSTGQIKIVPDFNEEYFDLSSDHNRPKT